MKTTGYYQSRAVGGDYEIAMQEMMIPFEGSSILNKQHSQGVCGTPRPFWCSNPLDISEADDHETDIAR